MMKTITRSHRKPSEYGKVGVLMGGESAEREVSLNSGKNVLEALLKAGVDAHGVDVRHATFLNVLQQQNFDMVFIALHGRGGEDGQMQALLDFLRIPYTGSGVEASAVCMNKRLTKDIWKTYGLPVLPGMRLEEGFDPQEVVDQVGLPLAVKPCHEGSTVGISRVNHIDELMPAYKTARQCGNDIITEPWITGQEYTVGIIGEDILPSIKIIPASEYYDYHAKYVSNETQYLIPSGLSDAQERDLQSMCMKAYQAVNCEGWARLDLIRDEQGKFWLFEINTSPGLTSHSLVPKAITAMGYTFTDLVFAVLESALRRRADWAACA